MISNIYRGKKVSDGLWVVGYLNYQGALPYIVSNNTGKTYFVSPDTLCKCLDIKDKNNRLIFEGDIINTYYKGDKKAIIYYDEEHLCWRLNYKLITNKKKTLATRPLLEASKAKYYLVLGNIFDNPEHYAFQFN